MSAEVRRAGEVASFGHRRLALSPEPTCPVRVGTLELRYGTQGFWCLIARDEREGVVTDFIGRKRVAFISYDGHSDFLETSRVYHGWKWSIYDGEQVNSSPVARLASTRSAPANPRKPESAGYRNAHRKYLRSNGKS